MQDYYALLQLEISLIQFNNRLVNTNIKIYLPKVFRSCAVSFNRNR